MKKTFSAIAALVIAASMLSGCGLSEDETKPITASDKTTASEPGTGGPDLSEVVQEIKGGEIEGKEIKTFADIYALENMVYRGFELNYDSYSMVFEYNGSVYCATAEITEDLYNTLVDIEYADEKDEAKEKELLTPLEISTVQNRSESVLPQEELDKLVGKQGKDLLGDGWTYNGHIDPNSFYMIRDGVTYRVSTDESADISGGYAFSDMEYAISSFTINSVELDSMY